MNQTEKTKRAVIYCRVSTREQVEEGNSLTTQERICRDFCQKSGFEVAGVFLEQGESAKTADRTQLRQLLAFCTNRKNGVQMVVIYKLDRLSRNTDDYSQIRILLKRYQVDIKSTSEYFENTPVGRFMENTIANVAQFDNDIRTERSIGGMKEAMREGRYVWISPVGYRNARVGGKKTIELDPKTAPLVRKAFEMIATNRHQAEEVRRLLVAEGLTTRAGTTISKAQFFRMIENPVYAGWIVKFGERHQGRFEALVTDELFRHVRRVLKGRSRDQAPYRKNHPDFPLRRFVRSPAGRKLTGGWSRGRYRKYPYYSFQKRATNFAKEALENSFARFMDRFFLDPAQIESLRILVRENLDKATADRRKLAAGLAVRLEELGKRQTAVIAKNLEGVIPDAALSTQLDIIEKEIMETRTAIADQSDETIDYAGALDLAEEFLRSPGEVWKRANGEIRVKLQWFKFPSGVVYENGEFRTTEIALIFKLKEAFRASLSHGVHLNHASLNQFFEKGNPGSVKDEIAIISQIGRTLDELRRILSDNNAIVQGAGLDLFSEGLLPKLL